MAMDAESETKAMNELKKNAVDYYSKAGPANDVMPRMEDILNSMFFENPDDIYGHLTNYFACYAKPAKLTQIKAREAIDCRGMPTVQTEIFVRQWNREKLLTSVTAYSSMAEELVEGENQKCINTALETINCTISEMLAGKDFLLQAEIDSLLSEVFARLQRDEDARKELERVSLVEVASLTEIPKPDAKGKGKTAEKPGKNKGGAVEFIPDEPPEVLLCGCDAMAAVSSSVCMAAAITSGCEPYEYIAKLWCSMCRSGGTDPDNSENIFPDTDELSNTAQEPDMFYIPLPMVTILTQGKASVGKLNCIKEYMVVPSPDLPLKLAVKAIGQIYNYCAKKLNLRITNEAGALGTVFDRPEQGVDLLHEAITAVGATPGTEFHLAINCAGNEFFDYEKGKYEVVVGQLKTAEELAKFWVDFLAAQPTIIAIIDPMRKADKENWMSLTVSVSERCYVIGDTAYSRPARLLKEQLTPEFQTSGVVLRLECMNTITDVLKCAEKMDTAGNQIVIASSVGDTADALLADFAVGCGARFLKLGGPTRGERVAKLNRLLEIESRLEYAKKLGAQEAHMFPLIKAPTPPEPSEDTDGPIDEGASSPKGKKK